jgi:hypothetical protein
MKNPNLISARDIKLHAAIRHGSWLLSTISRSRAAFFAALAVADRKAAHPINASQAWFHQLSRRSIPLWPNPSRTPAGLDMETKGTDHVG